MAVECPMCGKTIEVKPGDGIVMCECGEIGFEAEVISNINRIQNPTLRLAYEINKFLAGE